MLPAKLFITIDVEEDSWGEFENRDPAVYNISRIPLIQKIFDRLGAVPTYLLTYPVVKNENSRRIIRKILDTGRCEIGAHCHPWNTPPFIEHPNNYNSMLCNLPLELAYEKIRTLHNEIKDRLCVEPKCFRAGRWGFSPSVAKCIHDLGYEVDTSVTPFCNWINEKGPDFSKAPAFPYRFDLNSILLEKSDGPLLEIPPTIGFFQRDFIKCARIRKFILDSPFARIYLLSVLDKLKLLNFRFLSPEFSTGSEMIRLAKNCIRTGHKSLNMSFHSTSLLPGKNPFVKAEHELKELINRIEMFLQYAVDKGFEFAPLSHAPEFL